MTKMSSFLMSYPHVQGSMGGAGAGYEPKFPPTEPDFHHLHHQYGAMNGLTANHVDYSYHNGYNYGNYTPAPTTHSFYHHHPHPPYGSPQMHHPTNPSSPNLVVSQTNSYAPNVINSNSNSSNNSSGIGSRNNSLVQAPAVSNSGTNAIPVQSVVNGLNVSENSPNVDSNMGYYSNYYGNTNGHHNPHDLPLQCPNSTEPPTNTALGLQELGMYNS